MMMTVWLFLGMATGRGKCNAGGCVYCWLKVNLQYSC